MNLLLDYPFIQALIFSLGHPGLYLYRIPLFLHSNHQNYIFCAVVAPTDNIRLLPLWWRNICFQPDTIFPHSYHLSKLLLYGSKCLPSKSLGIHREDFSLICHNDSTCVPKLSCITPSPPLVKTFLVKFSERHGEMSHIEHFHLWSTDSLKQHHLCLLNLGF